MLQHLKEILKDSKPLILGFGCEGRSTYKAIRKVLPGLKVFVADANENVAHSLSNNDTDLYFITGKDYLKNLSDFNVIFRSPGIPLKDINPVFYPFLTSQTKLFLEVYKKNICGITGTKGKSTSSSLIAHILKIYNGNTILAGNIGVPLFDMIENINDDSEIICELSSHQLQDVMISPHISVLLNIFREHLDHYNSWEEYQQAKINIIAGQRKGDICIVNADDDIVTGYLKNYNTVSEIYSFSALKEVERGCFIKGNSIIYRDKGRDEVVFVEGVNHRNINGVHNLMNIMAAAIVCKIKRVPDNVILEGLSTMPALQHRMEYAGTVNGISFYDDSIATIPEAAIAAVKSIPNVESIILGGFDRGVEYEELAAFLANSGIKLFLFIDKAGKRIMNNMQQMDCSGKKLIEVDNLEDAVDIAVNETAAGKVCLLSPAAASYGMFKNFEERGDIFKNLILSKAK